jgi:sterol desaturase/sphingolipid hydroxylase (fatty acid hydroxylase superfamily)
MEAHTTVTDTGTPKPFADLDPLAIRKAMRGNEERSSKTPWLITWFTWPVLFISGISIALVAVRNHYTYSTIYTGLLISWIVILVFLEWRFPLDQRWKMTWRSFIRDVKFLLTGAVTIAVVNGVFGWIAIRVGHKGPTYDWPLYLSVPTALLAFELLQYWQHRLSHEMGGPIGRFLWKTHVAHHLPDGVYVFMHAVAHPANIVLVRGFVILLPLYILGANPETILLFNVISNLQGFVSHLNLDLRAGWLNYIFVGTELHRYHHSARMEESKNYAVTLSLLDVLFGTFRYRPGRAPARLGVEDPKLYPDSKQWWGVMQIPFRG